MGLNTPPMKNILIALIFLPLLSHAQDTDIIQGQATPGNELLKAKNIMNASFVVSGLGIALSLISIPTEQQNYSDIGTGLAVAGLIVFIIGVQHIGKAGNLMNDNKLGVTFNSGIGLRYRI